MFRLRFMLLCAASLFAPGTPSVAQPAPIFEATCSDLRAALKKADLSPEDWVVIDVVGTLRVAEHDGTLGYMVLCSKPDPEIVCVTYEVNDYKVGDRVVVSGTYHRVDDDHISLDPCLHYPPS